MKQKNRDKLSLNILQFLVDIGFISQSTHSSSIVIRVAYFHSCSFTRVIPLNTSPQNPEPINSVNFVIEKIDNRSNSQWLQNLRQGCGIPREFLETPNHPVAQRKLVEIRS
eukprot:TRINITY_DN11415_c0_g4_i1.p1 TRINITY_DN11415_c0_g4~~TRINITY_DN11415_c0_g4_i1.p1  ORF type:complete len:123 (+),score=15.17 TRINITY_DN11415_c0_g4_i1:39-371(+)